MTSEEIRAIVYYIISKAYKLFGKKVIMRKK